MDVGYFPGRLIPNSRTRTGGDVVERGRGHAGERSDIVEESGETGAHRPTPPRVGAITTAEVSVVAVRTAHSSSRGAPDACSGVIAG